MYPITLTAKSPSVEIKAQLAQGTVRTVSRPEMGPVLSSGVMLFPSSVDDLQAIHLSEAETTGLYVAADYVSRLSDFYVLVQINPPTGILVYDTATDVNAYPSTVAALFWATPDYEQSVFNAIPVKPLPIAPSSNSVIVACDKRSKIYSYNTSLEAIYKSYDTNSEQARLRIKLYREVMESCLGPLEEEETAFKPYLNPLSDLEAVSMVDGPETRRYQIEGRLFSKRNGIEDVSIAVTGPTTNNVFRRIDLNTMIKERSAQTPSETVIIRDDRLPHLILNNYDAGSILDITDEYYINNNLLRVDATGKLLRVDAGVPAGTNVAASLSTIASLSMPYQIWCQITGPEYGYEEFMAVVHSDVISTGFEYGDPYNVDIAGFPLYGKTRLSFRNNRYCITSTSLYGDASMLEASLRTLHGRHPDGLSAEGLAEMITASASSYDGPLNFTLKDEGLCVYSDRKLIGVIPTTEHMYFNDFKKLSDIAEGRYGEKTCI